MSPSVSLHVLVQSGLLLLFANCVMLENFEHAYLKSSALDISRDYAWWPSVHNAAALRRRRQAELNVPGQTEGGTVISKETPALVSPSVITPVLQLSEQNKTDSNVQTEPLKDFTTKDNTTNSTKLTTIATPIDSKVISNDGKQVNSTVTNKAVAKDIDLNSPGVLKRGLIVFGGFTLLAVAYFIFYRRKSKKNDSSNTHSTIDANQFRYGVLQSEDQRDNLESSIIPLTMESDDDEEDLEVFDLEQKKKSLSYVNLQMNDEDVVLSRTQSTGNDMDNLLLDIEDGNSETLIHWSSSGNKSIL